MTGLKLTTDNLKAFIKERREQAEYLLGDNFASNIQKHKYLRDENARAFNWFCDELEYRFPELK